MEIHCQKFYGSIVTDRPAKQQNQHVESFQHLNEDVLPGEDKVWTISMARKQAHSQKTRALYRSQFSLLCMTQINRPISSDRNEYPRNLKSGNELVQSLATVASDGLRTSGNWPWFREKFPAESLEKKTQNWHHDAWQVHICCTDSTRSELDFRRTWDNMT